MRSCTRTTPTCTRTNEVTRNLFAAPLRYYLVSRRTSRVRQATLSCVVHPEEACDLDYGAALASLVWVVTHCLVGMREANISVLCIADGYEK
jgi:hypothetical protein